jgi:hypothetical protein
MRKLRGVTEKGMFAFCLGMGFEYFQRRMDIHRCIADRYGIENENGNGVLYRVAFWDLLW